MARSHFNTPLVAVTNRLWSVVAGPSPGDRQSMGVTLSGAQAGIEWPDAR